jgi:hypothetical protein
MVGVPRSGQDRSTGLLEDEWCATCDSFSKGSKIQVWRGLHPPWQGMWSAVWAEVVDHPCGVRCGGLHGEGHERATTSSSS